MEPETSFNQLSINSQPSSIYSTIQNIKEKADPLDFIKQDRETSLLEYTIGLDNCRNKIFITAEVHPDTLDKGCDPSEYSCMITNEDGVRGDRPAQLIGKKLGGDGFPRNIFPLNEKFDTTNWKADEDLVYTHVKKGGNRHAKLSFGIETSDEVQGKIRRPFKIYYYFQLFENGEFVGNAIEGVVENIDPMATHDFYYYNCGVKTFYNKSNNSD